MNRLSFLCLLGIWLCACSGNEPSVEVGQAWSPAMPPGTSVAAVYMELSTNVADTLLSVSSPVADEAGMHATVEEGGMMHMQPMSELRMSPGESVNFEPGGRHIMLGGVEQALPVGMHFDVTLHFAVAGAIPVKVEVVAPGAMP